MELEVHVIQCRDIVFLTTGLARGGAETQLVRLASELKRRGWTVHIIALLGKVDFVPELTAAEISWTALGAHRGKVSPLVILQVLRLLARMRPAILVSFMFHANILGRILGRIARVPVIVSSIRTEQFGASWRPVCLRWTEPLASATTLNSTTVRDRLIDRRVTSADRSTVIPNMADVSIPALLPAERDFLREELAGDSTNFLWLAVGSMVAAKDYPNLIRAARALVDAGARFRIVIVGRGLLEPQLKELVQEHGLEGVVSLAGFRTDVPALLQTADALVLSSAWEGMPNVVMEALAAGIPVVSTDVGGASELFVPGVSGFLVPPMDAPALAAGMKQLMSIDRATRLEMGAAGRRRIVERHSVGPITDQWEALFSSLRPLAGPDRRVTGRRS